MQVLHKCSFFYPKVREYIQKQSACAAPRRKVNPLFSRWVPHLDASDFPYKYRPCLSPRMTAPEYIMWIPQISRTPNTADLSLLYSQNKALSTEWTGKIVVKDAKIYALSFCKKEKSSFSKGKPKRLSGTSLAERRMHAAVKSDAKRMAVSSDLFLAKQPTNAAANTSPAPQKKPSTFSCAYVHTSLFSFV